MPPKKQKATKAFATPCRHNAYFYGHYGFKHINPAFQGIYQTLQADLQAPAAAQGIAWVAHAINSGLLRARHQGSVAIIKWKGQVRQGAAV